MIKFMGRTLHKGDTISHEDLEAYVDVKRTSADYSTALMRVRQKLQDEWCYENNGDSLYLKQDRTGLHLVKDGEAVKLGQRRFMGRLAGAYREHSNMSRIPTAELTPREQRRLDRSLLIQGSVLQAATDAMSKHKLTAPSVTRATPLPPGREED